MESLILSPYEIARVIAFMSRLRDAFRPMHGKVEDDAHWRIISHVVKRFIEGGAVTLTELIQISELPYATAHRKINELLREHMLEKFFSGSDTKRFQLIPSNLLLDQFYNYAKDVKVELARVYGDKNFSNDEEYFFGGDHQALALSEDQLRAVRNIDGVEKATFLLHNDFYFMSLRHLWSDFRKRLGPYQNFHMRNMEDLHAELLANAKRPESTFDIVALNAPWVGQFAEAGAVINLNSLTDARRVVPQSFNPEVWDMGMSKGKQFGIPSYAAVEILAARKDLLETEGLKSPATFADVLKCGRALHDPNNGRYGIVWNASRGIDVAHTFMFIIGCCGAPIPDLAQVKGGFEKKDMNGGKVRALIDSYAAHEALEYMKELLSISPPNILETSRQTVLDLFTRGKAAMAYTWSIHATRFEMQIDSAVKRRVTYLQPPFGRGGKSLAPLGGFVFAIPSNLPPLRMEKAMQILTWMCSPEAMLARAKDGLPLSPLFSLMGDPGANLNSPIYTLVKSLSQRRLLNVWQRPAIPKYIHIETILGEEVHDALIGHKSIKVALADANTRIKSLDQDLLYS
ncbi:extracellular solute-binding protein [Ochrobactrum sp. Q0168]|uniref:extracellular solute-binding protein n=1 Tax=Ochrobactrum sp. Q0168 TaxID=2793241 RepID=UPI0018ECBB27|nr:extracellular solute-binding protein [Ochrobactrum sp. Q0168]